MAATIATPTAIFFLLFLIISLFFPFGYDLD
jgi:hypothetical protein